MAHELKHLLPACKQYIYERSNSFLEENVTPYISSIYNRFFSSSSSLIFKPFIFSLLVGTVSFKDSYADKYQEFCGLHTFSTLERAPSDNYVDDFKKSIEEYEYDTVPDDIGLPPLDEENQEILKNEILSIESYSNEHTIFASY